MIINKYPDGSSYAIVNNTHEDFFTFRLNTYEDLWHLNQLVDAYNNLGVVPIVTIPNLIDAQADRRFNSNESSGLKLVCKFLNSMKANFVVFHPHNSEIVEALINNVTIVDNYDFISHVLSENLNKDNLILFSSDAGGFKPLMKLSDKLNWVGEVYGASKSRTYIDGKSRLTQVIDREDFQGKDILIIDDICVNGGTFIGLANMLKSRNAGKLYLAISHLTVSNPNPELFNLFDKIFTTDSKNLNYLVEGTGHDRIGYTPENLKIIKLF
jgi:ribose-phosphate pyrophosphokinase